MIISANHFPIIYVQATIKFDLKSGII